MSDMGDTVFTLLLWVIVLCSVFGLAAYISDRIEETRR